MPCTKHLNGETPLKHLCRDPPIRCETGEKGSEADADSNSDVDVDVDADAGQTALKH